MALSYTDHIKDTVHQDVYFGFVDQTMYTNWLRRNIWEFYKESLLMNASNENVLAEHKCEAEKVHDLQNSKQLEPYFDLCVI